MSERSRRVGLRQVGLNLLAAGLLLSGIGCSGGDITAPTTGTINITTTTSGPAPDADGYAVAIDAGAEAPLGVNATLRRDNLEPGTHSVRLTGMAANCAVEGENPRSVTVSAGTSTDVRFAIVCGTTTGSLTISTTTTGPSPDPDGYTVTVDATNAQPIGVNGTLSIPLITPDGHSVALAGIAVNCQVTGDNPRRVTIAAGAPAAIAFTVACAAPVIARWTPMTSGTTMALRSVWGSSASNVFAEGDSVLHYDGHAWSSASKLSGTEVWSSSPTQGFALVDNGTEPFASFKFYDGSETHGPVEGPAGGDVAVLIYAIWGSSPTDVFAVGLLLAGIDYWQPYVLHFDGNDWVRLPVPPEESVYVTPYAVWGSSGSDVYAVGVYLPPDAGPGEERGVIAHYDGHQWTEVLREPNLGLDHIWGSSATDVYATGSTDVSLRASVGAIRHFDGRRWSALTSPTAARLGAVWGTSPSNLFVLADDHTIWQFDGATWKLAYTSASALYAIWGSSATDAFAVGEKGAILHGTP